MAASATTELDYLKLLARDYPSVAATSNAIVERSALLNLPKGTEHFVSDIHGEFEAFQHVLRNGSGSLRRKINELFAAIPQAERQELATLIYYPERKLSRIWPQLEDRDTWSQVTLLRLVRLGQDVSSKYTRGRVREFLPDEMAVLLEELLYGRDTNAAQEMYYNSIIDTIIDINSARAFIIALAELIQQLSIARLHVIGDVYDRGPGAHRIMDTLMNYHTVDMQWGNHDIVWMGAAAGSEACIANVVRIALRYGQTDTLETGYGISLLPLVSFALEAYDEDSCEAFVPKIAYEAEYTENEIRLMARMHKAITVIQLKLEAAIIKRRPHYQMEDRLLLDKIDHQKGTVYVDGQDYAMLDMHFPTIEPAAPYRLTESERLVVERLRLSFANSRRLQRHVRFLYSHGGMYLVHNGNLLYHGCIAMNPDGSFQNFHVDGQDFHARAFMDRADRLARQAYFGSEDSDEKLSGMDAMWYLWSGPKSPLFGKAKMATFERYFIAEEETHVEERNPYYQLRDNEATARKILAEFGLDPNTGHIVNGHVPVKVKKGESPIKANGKLLVIDGGFAKAYQEKTGIAGYTLIYNSYGLLLAAHQPFESIQKAIDENADMVPKTEILERNDNRILVRYTDEGHEILQHIEHLHTLLGAYRNGLIKENI